VQRPTRRRDPHIADLLGFARRAAVRRRPARMLLSTLRKWYIGKMGKRLSQYGLTYHDVTSEGCNGVLDKAVSRLPEHMQASRPEGAASCAMGKAGGMASGALLRQHRPSDCRSRRHTQSR